jgi:hypothetical protein
VNKNMLDRLFTHHINAPSSSYFLLKVLLQKRGMGYAKENKKELRKIDIKVFEILKTMGT